MLLRARPRARWLCRAAPAPLEGNFSARQSERGTLRDYRRAALGEADVAPGAIGCVQSFGALAHWHPHLHVLMTDGAYRRDGTLVPAPAHDAAVLEKAWRRAVLAGFVAQGWLEEGAAQAMLAWPHSGFGAHVGPPLAGIDREGLLRVARYDARAPITESRLRYLAERAQVERVSDARAGPEVGVHRRDVVEFLVRWVHHVPERYETRVRDAGADATRRRVWWRRRGIARVEAARAEATPPEPREDGPARRARRRRWAELLRRVFPVEVETSPDPPAVGAPRRGGPHCRVRHRAARDPAPPRPS